MVFFHILKISHFKVLRKKLFSILFCKLDIFYNCLAENTSKILIFNRILNYDRSVNIKFKTSLNMIHPVHLNCLR
jgi:hypothetical protein